MPGLYLTEQGATLRKEGDLLLVTKESQELIKVAAIKVEGRPLKNGYIRGFLLFNQVGNNSDICVASLDHRSVPGQLV